MLDRSDTVHRQEEMKVTRWKTGKPCLGEGRGQNGSLEQYSLEPTLELFDVR
jgi:hypothetical protein